MTEMGPRSVTNIVFILLLAGALAFGLLMTVDMFKDVIASPSA
jgi:hypothetical protein